MEIYLNYLEKPKDHLKNMGFIKFWIMTTLFFTTFPLSLFFCLIFLGPNKTKQFIFALINDFLQTLFIIFMIIFAVMYFLIDYLGTIFN